MNIPEYTPALVVALPLLGAFLTPLVGRINDKLRNIVAILFALLTTALVFLLAYSVLTNGIHVYVFGADTAQTLGNLAQGVTLVRILFEVDAMSVFMAIISSILALAAIVYSWAFMKENTGLDKYYTLLLLMLAGMLGMELTGDMFNFFVFLEITSISSAALVAFWTKMGESVEAGFKYIVVSSVGALFVLFAIALFYGQYDALNMAVIGSSIQYTMLDKIALILLIGALGMKAGIVPMHMWLPDSYGRAPSSVTVALVATTLASLYGLFRVIFTIYGNQLANITRQFNWGDDVVSFTLNGTLGAFLIILAIVTILIGVIMALRQTDFKRLIAYAAVAEIGYMFLGIGTGLAAIGTPHGLVALKGGIFHILNDALDVGLLFLVAGAIYYTTREFSLNKLSGLGRNMKYTAVFFIIGLLAVSGMPPLNGFASKLLIYQSTFHLSPILSIIAILASIMMLAVFVKVFYSAFMGPKLTRYQDVKEVPKSMLIAMGFIACIIIFIGLFPELIINNIVTPAAEALLNHGAAGGGYIGKIIASAVGGVI